ncbi:MAG: RNase adapter RapZ [Deltaproteobacteria bacterium]|nr:RNase adapter RapZ [Deltaproteobacteria bacterium]
MRVVIITGVSGSGKTAALHALEDLRFYSVDNLPLPLLPVFVDLMERTQNVDQAAVVVDARSGDTLKRFDELAQQIRKRGNHIDVLFLDATENTLLRRFSETRRKHPLGSENLVEALGEERRLLEGLRREATTFIDTDALTPHGLKRIMWDRYGTAKNEMSITVESFGFRHGLPLEADLVFDVRFLANPFFVEELASLPGTDRRVAEYVSDSDDAREFLKRTMDLLTFALPRYAKEGKTYLTIAIGCTGGRHRSVAMALKVKENLEQIGIFPSIRHRDMDREQWTP